MERAASSPAQGGTAGPECKQPKPGTLLCSPNTKPGIALPSSCPGRAVRFCRVIRLCRGRLARSLVRGQPRSCRLDAVAAITPCPERCCLPCAAGPPRASPPCGTRLRGHGGTVPIRMVRSPLATSPRHSPRHCPYGRFMRPELAVCRGCLR